MNSPAGSENLADKERANIEVHVRDSIWSATIVDGIAATIELRNNSDEMLPDERAVASATALRGQFAQSEMYEAYKDVPGQVLERMVEDQKLPASEIDEDYISVAGLGLLEAMRGWDASAQENFRTYASRIIARSVISYFAEMGEASGLPVLHHQHRATVESLGDDTDEDEYDIFNRLGLNPFEYIPVLAKGRRPAWDIDHYSPVAYLELLSRFSRTGREALSDTVSMNEVVDEATENDRLINNQRPDQVFDHDPTATSAIRTSLRSDIREVIAQLPESQRKVLIARFGLEDGRVSSLDYVAALSPRQTRERIRQIEIKALAKLRQWYPNEPGSHLKSYVDTEE